MRQTVRDLAQDNRAAHGGAMRGAADKSREKQRNDRPQGTRESRAKGGYTMAAPCQRREQVQKGFLPRKSSRIANKSQSR